MNIRWSFIVLLAAISLSAGAQVHLGKSIKEITSTFGDDNTNVHDEKGNTVIAYINEIKDHPKFGSYTLYSLYVFENDSCMMQQTLMPLNQKEDIGAGLNSLYEKVRDSVWKSKDGIYYILASDSQNLRLKVMSEAIYLRDKY